MNSNPEVKIFTCCLTAQHQVIWLMLSDVTVCHAGRSSHCTKAGKCQTWKANVIKLLLFWRLDSCWCGGGQWTNWLTGVSSSEYNTVRPPPVCGFTKRLVQVFWHASYAAESVALWNENEWDFYFWNSGRLKQLLRLGNSKMHESDRLSVRHLPRCNPKVWFGSFHLFKYAPL